MRFEAKKEGQRVCKRGTAGGAVGHKETKILNRTCAPDSCTDAIVYYTVARWKETFAKTKRKDGIQ